MRFKSDKSTVSPRFPHLHDEVEDIKRSSLPLEMDFFCWHWTSERPWKIDESAIFFGTTFVRSHWFCSSFCSVDISWLVEDTQHECMIQVSSNCHNHRFSVAFHQKRTEPQTRLPCPAICRATPREMFFRGEEYFHSRFLWYIDEWRETPAAPSETRLQLWLSTSIENGWVLFFFSKGICTEEKRNTEKARQSEAKIIFDDVYSCDSDWMDDWVVWDTIIVERPYGIRRWKPCRSRD